MNLKKSADINEQVALLISKGVKIDDCKEAAHTLLNVSYYQLKGYLLKYKNRKTNTYENPPSFNHIFALYKFDCELRNIYLYAIEAVEQAIKTYLAYVIATENPDNPAIYKEEIFFKNKQDHVRFINGFESAVNARKQTPFVKHHIDKYNREFPIWVASEFFTLGDIQYLYKNIPNKLRRMISTTYNTSPDVIDNWIDNLRRTRNLAAHNMRIYDVSFPYSPKHSKAFDEKLPLTKKFFDQFYLLKILHPSNLEWKHIVLKIEKIFESYEKIIDLRAIGFPDNWNDYLSFTG